MSREKSSTRPIQLDSALIFAIALSVRVFLLWYLKVGFVLERTEIIHMAIALAHGQGFANPYGGISGATAHASPIYPLMLAVIFKLFGTGPAGAFAQQTFGCILSSAAYALLPMLASRCGLGRRTGVLAGVAAAVLPVNFWPERGTFENTLAALLVIAFLLRQVEMWRRAQFTLGDAIRSGLLWGFALLTAPVFLIPILAAGAATFLAFPNKLVVVRYTAAAWAVTAAIQAPWVIRNYYALGGFVWSRSNLGLELAVSNTDDASPRGEVNTGSGSGPHSRLHPYANQERFDHMKEAGELAFDRECMILAKTWIRSHPGMFLTLVAERIYYFWIPALLRPAQTVIERIVSILGLIGMAMWLWRERTAASINMAVFLLSFPLTYYVVETTARYRYPIEPLLMMLAWSAVLAVFQRAAGLSLSRRQIKDGDQSTGNAVLGR